MTALKTSSGSKKAASSALGAPSQLKQSSRKRKRAWRKNVDLQDLEETLEGLRAEERITGCVVFRAPVILQRKPSPQVLFTKQKR
jgi:nucleolar protein 53